MVNKFTGTGVALVTPFKKDKSIDFQSLENLLNHVTEGGVDYLVVCGTTGESVTLQKEERKAVLNFVKENNPGKLPVVYGIGGYNTTDCLNSIENTDFKDVGALLSVSPYYNKPSQEGIIKHYEIIADKCPVPVILYNVPGRTSSNLTWKTTLELAKHPNIVGIKEASGDLNQCMRIIRGSSDDFLLISGDDLLTLPLMSVGASGVISVLANAFPRVFKNIVSNCLSENYQQARIDTLSLLEINPLMYSEGNPVGIKEVLAQMGICSGEVRLPHSSASETLKKGISDALGQIKA